MGSLPPPIDIVHLPSVHQMADLAHITPAEVESSLKSSKIKTSALDPLPGTLVKTTFTSSLDRLAGLSTNRLQMLLSPLA